MAKYRWLLLLSLTLAACSGGGTNEAAGGGSTGSMRSVGSGGGGGRGGHGSGGSGAAGGPDATSASSGGGGGSSTSNGAGTGGGCGDTTSDPLNCGSCGRSCLGAPCEGGLCTSTLIASGIATSLAVSSQAVVWGTSTGARAADLDGSSPRSVNLGVAVRVPAVAGNADSTAFVVGTDVLVFDATASTMTDNQSATSPVVLAADPGHIYWADGNGHAGLYQLDPISHAVVQVAFPTPPPVALSVGDGLVCWVAFTTGSDGSVRCISKDQTGTGAGTLLEQGKRSPCSVAAAAGKVFWAECPAGEAASVSEASDQDGSGSVTLSGIATTAVATDGVSSYWADHGVFRRINVSSGVIDDRAVAPSNVGYLVAGADRLYWANASGVRWVAK